MGMFDEVFCEYELPAGLGLTHRNFQTKSLHSALDRFTITKEGRLIYHPVRYVWAQEAPQGLFGKMVNSVPEPDIDTHYHGDILLIDAGEGEPIELVARFTHGQLEWLRPMSELSEAERMFLK
jgi:hypothetical protein